AKALIAGIGKGAGEIRRHRDPHERRQRRARDQLAHLAGPSEPIAPTIGRVVHLPCMPSFGSVGAVMATGGGASQFGGDQTLPSGFSVLRNNWQEARAIAMPPETNSASTTRILRPSRIRFVLTSIGVMMFGRRNMSTVKRAGTKSSAP